MTAVVAEAIAERRQRIALGLNWGEPMPAPATGATAGSPGSWTPAGSLAPTSTGLLAGTPVPVVANPATAWTTGQYVKCRDNVDAHWTGTAWATGRATVEAASTSRTARKRST